MAVSNETKTGLKIPIFCNHVSLPNFHKNSPVSTRHISGCSSSNDRNPLVNTDQNSTIHFSLISESIGPSQINLNHFNFDTPGVGGIQCLYGWACQAPGAT